MSHLVSIYFLGVAANRLLFVRQLDGAFVQLSRYASWHDASATGIVIDMTSVRSLKGFISPVW